MTVRVTESRLPAGFLAAELGEASLPVTLPDGAKYFLVAFLTTPVRTDTFQEYVLFAIDGDADEYHWTIEPIGEAPIATSTTHVGSFSWSYTSPGPYEIRVEVVRGGAVVAAPTMLQTVVSPSSADELLITSHGTDGSSADVLRELVNDFRPYAQLAAAATGPMGVPPRLVDAILYLEGLARPKRGTKGAEMMTAAGDGAHIRDREIDDLADLYQAGRPIIGPSPFLGAPPLPASLGAGQLGQWRVAALQGLIPWREGAAAGTPGLAIDRRFVTYLDVSNFITTLQYPEQVDIFNLVRFPKTNIALVAQLLARLKNRAHRWPAVVTADVLRDPDLVGVIATEYNLGPTATPAALAKASVYGGFADMQATPGIMSDLPVELFP